MANVLVNAPKTAKKGQVVEIKALIMHVMETGYRPGTNGRIIPRNIIQDFSATWNGREIHAVRAGGRDAVEREGGDGRQVVCRLSQ
jgi:sulfur-oxidizing protein SoxZ